MEDNNITVLRPQEGFQEKFLSSEADIVIGGGAAGCFVGNTLVQTSTGHKPIQDIKVGELVLSFNTTTKQMEYKPVIETFRYGGNNDLKWVARIVNESVWDITCTINHEFLINDVWTPARKLLDKMNEGGRYTNNTDFCQELPTKEIVSLSMYKTNRYVYDLCVLDNHNYTVTTDNIIVHNSGKALSLDTTLINEWGWRVGIDSLKVGMKVMGDDGKPTTITAIHDHKNLVFYEVEFNDNTKVKACIDHLWRVRERGGDWKVMDTFNLMLQEDAYNIFEVPLVKPLQLEEIDCLPIDPYVLGVFIGTGTFMEDGSVILRIDIEELANFASILPTPTSIKDCGDWCQLVYEQYSKQIRKLALNGNNGNNKFVPNIFLKGSIEQRLAMLQGLMDCDKGTLNFLTTSKVNYSSNNETIINAVVQLVRSLGGLADVTDMLTFLFVDIKMPYYNPFRQTKKASRFEYSFKAKKTIRSIKRIENQDGRCITVDNKNRCYITEDYTVTHNSYALLLELGRLINVDNATGVVFRRTSPELRAGGGLWDSASTIYGALADVNNTKLELVFPNTKSKIKFSHLQKEGDVHSHQGSQYAFIGFDEIQHFTWKQFNYMLSRNRTMTNINPYIRCTCNPETGTWLKEFINWWIGEDGYPIEERDGQLRYMYSKGDKVSDIIWGDTKQEVIDALGGLLEETAIKFNVQPEDLIKSVTFIAGSLDDNKKLLASNPQYIANLLAQSVEEQAKLLYGNWNDYSDDTMKLFTDTTNIFGKGIGIDSNGMSSISIDPARSGKDLAIIMAWQGLEVVSISIFTKCTTEDIHYATETYRDIYSVPRNRVVVDSDGVGGGVVDRGKYIGINNGGRPINAKNETTNFNHLKSQLYYLGARIINNHELTGFKIHTNQIYVDGKKTNKVNGEFVMDIILREFNAFTRDLGTGKKRINTKDEVKAVIGHSPNFTDCIMYNLYLYLNRPINNLNKSTN